LWAVVVAAVLIMVAAAVLVDFALDHLLLP
jgi:hypothetical protein